MNATTTAPMIIAEVTCRVRTQSDLDALQHLAEATGLDIALNTSVRWGMRRNVATLSLPPHHTRVAERALAFFARDLGVA